MLQQAKVAPSTTPLSAPKPWWRYYKRSQWQHTHCQFDLQQWKFCRSLQQRQDHSEPQLRRWFECKQQHSSNIEHNIQSKIQRGECSCVPWWETNNNESNQEEEEIARDFSYFGHHHKNTEKNKTNKQRRNNLNKYMNVDVEFPLCRKDNFANEYYLIWHYWSGPFTYTLADALLQTPRKWLLAVELQKARWKRWPSAVPWEGVRHG